MGDRLTETARGALLIADQRCINMDNVAANTGAANLSSYTEANPRPGSAVTTDPHAKLRPVISGGQGTDADVRVSVGGFPGREGCKLIYKEDTDAATDWRGWIMPVIPVGWLAVEWTDATTYNRFDVTVIPSSQTALVAYGGSVGDTVIRTFSYDSPGVWSSTVTPTFPVALTDGGPMSPLVIPGSERILLVQWDATTAANDSGALEVSYSDDDGATWAAYSSPVRYADAANPFGAGNFPTTMRTAYQPSSGNIALMLSDQNQRLVQYASNDLLNTVTLVANLGTSTATHVHCFAIPGSSAFGVLYQNAGDDIPRFARLGSAYESLANASPVEIDASTTVDDITGYADPDGTLFAIGRKKAAGSKDIVVVWASYDGGATWEADDEVLSLGSGTGPVADINHLENFASVAASGQGLLIHNWVATPGNEDGSIGSLFLGGWLSATATRNALQTPVTFSKDSDVSGRTWFPIDLLEDLDEWTRAGTAPTLAAGAMNISTAAATSISTNTAFTTPDDVAMGLWQGNLVSGTTVDLWQTRSGDGANMWEITLRLTSGGFEIYDDNAAAKVGTDVTGITTTGDLIIAWSVDEVSANTFEVVSFWWRLGDTKVTAGPTGALQTNASTLTNRVQYGHLSSVTAETNTKMLHMRGRPAATSTVWAQAGTDSEGHPTNALPYPLPDIGTSTAHAFLSAQAGPGRIGDSWDIDAQHDHPIEHCLPGLNPGTDKYWESTDKSEVRLVFTLADAATDLTRLGGAYSFGLGLIGCRGFRTAQVRGITTAGGNVLLDTLDLGVAVPFMDKIGSVFCPSLTETAIGSRLIRWGEYVGGYLVFNEGNSSHEIVHNNGGWWTRNTTARVHFRVATPTAAANTTDAEGNSIVSPSGVMVLHDADRTVYEAIEIRIPASQVSPWSNYRIGSLVLGGVMVPGQQPSNGWQKRQRLTNEETESRGGTRRIKELGRAVWDWSWSWVDGMLHSRMGINADYRASSVGAPMTTTQDVFHWLAGLVRNDLKSGEVVCIALEEMPDASGETITAPDLFNYGTLGVTVQATQIQGNDSAPEMVRVESILHRGLP